METMFILRCSEFIFLIKFQNFLQKINEKTGILIEL